MQAQTHELAEKKGIPSEAGDRRTSARGQVFMLVRTSQGTLWAHDIGLGGLLCRTKKAMWPGTFLDVQFTLPGESETIRAGAQVVALGNAEGSNGLTGGAEVSLRFCRLSARAELLLYRFLDRRRNLWSHELAAAQKSAAGKPKNNAQPFAGLLEEAYRELRLRQKREQHVSGMGPRPLN